MLWKVKLFEALPHAPGQAGAKELDQFGISADDHDGAKAKAREWLETRGHKVRSINFTDQERMLVAYVSPKEKKP